MFHFIKSLFKVLKTIIFIIFIAAVITLCVNNSQLINLSLNPLPYVVETRLFLLIIFFFVIGLIVGILINSVSLMKSKLHNSRNQKQLNKLKNDMERDSDRGFI